MFTKSELLQMGQVPESLFNYSINTGLIPSSDKILWLNPLPRSDCFPDYVLTDLLRISYLDACKVSSPWELKEFLLGGEGVTKYESDFKVKWTPKFGHSIKIL